MGVDRRTGEGADSRAAAPPLRRRLLLRLPAVAVDPAPGPCPVPCSAHHENLMGDAYEVGG